MQLGKDTGSVMNHLFSRQTKGQPVPVVGMGATLLGWTDRYAGTIVRVIQDKRGRYIVTVQEDEAKIVSGSDYDGSAVYEYSPNPLNCKHHFRFEEGKGWRGVSLADNGRVKLQESYGLKIGVREQYRDPSF